MTVMKWSINFAIIVNIKEKERKYSKHKNYYLKAKKEFKKMNEKLDSMSKEINNLRYLKDIQLSQECQRLSKINSDLVGPILILDRDLEQLQAQTAAKLNGEYVALITKRPIGFDWTVANEQLKAAVVDRTSGAQLFKVESGDVLLSVNNYNVSNVADGKKICQWLDVTILESEISLVDHETSDPLPFGSLSKHKKLEFKNATPCLFVFDILYSNGDSLILRCLLFFFL